MNAVDTNVLIYAHDPRDTVKQNIAIELIESVADAVLVWQVACEFLNASRKLEKFGFQQSVAWSEINELRLVWFTLLPSWEAIDRAADLQQRFSLSHWDSMLIASCLEGGLHRLYSEDFSAYPKIDGLEIINPFIAI